MIRLAQLKGFLNTLIRCVWLGQALAVGQHPSLLQSIDYNTRDKAGQYGIQCSWDKSRGAIDVTPKGTSIIGSQWYVVIGRKDENRLVLSMTWYLTIIIIYRFPCPRRKIQQ